MKYRIGCRVVTVMQHERHKLINGMGANNLKRQEIESVERITNEARGGSSRVYPDFFVH